MDIVISKSNSYTRFMNESEKKPKLIGAATDDHQIGDALYASGFNVPSDWAIQIEEAKSKSKPKSKFREGVLDLFMPACGCTAWLRQKFEGPLLIEYRVNCPLETLAPPEIQARDFNSFWHAIDPFCEADLFDETIYDGEFGNYHKMRGYYASTGGGGVEGNQTTRFRRYPRENADGSHAPHIALNDRDQNPEYLIVPGKWHKIQLIAAGQTVQYAVDGKVVYEVKEGINVAVEYYEAQSSNRPYTAKEFPAYNSGYFGLRLVRTHHVYSDLAIYQLVPKNR